MGGEGFWHAKILNYYRDKIVDWWVILEAIFNPWIKLIWFYKSGTGVTVSFASIYNEIVTGPLWG